MSDGEDAARRDPLDVLAEQFLSRYRSGEEVSVESFAAEHAEHADALLDLLPTLLALEDVKRDRISSGSRGGRVSLPALTRLGDFRIERELGRGGMGVVFEAVQESLDRRVALKVLPQASLLTGNQLERFQREAQIAARLHHTHIVPVYGSGESDGYHWYAMQFIQGIGLDRWREQQAECPPEGSAAWRSRARFVARIGAAAAEALHAAHGFGTLHRDIKPGNFLLDRDDHLWVTDFGLAKALEADGLTQSGDVLGTLQYMAPEQFAGSYDVRSEVYALGVTLYELLTLQPAFRGRNRSEIMDRVQSQRIERLAGLRDLPRDLVVIVDKAMAREPEDRYRDAEALRADLEAFVEDRPIQARRLSALATAWRWCRRNRSTSVLAAAALLAVLLAAVTGWVAYGMTTRAAEQARREEARAESNLLLSLAAFGDVFDALVGRDTALAYDENPDTGEQTVVVQSALSPRDVALLKQMLAFYDRFASENENSESLRYETTRAHRRVGAIHLRLGEPESLATAEVALQRALAGLDALGERDLHVDLVAVHVDLGHLYERLRRREDARKHFELALAQLQTLPNADSSSVRLQRAKVLFELARMRHLGRWRLEGPWESDEFVAAMALVGQLLQDDGDNPEVRVLHARCLREEARGPQGHLVAGEVVAILRELVDEHPNRAEYRFQLVEAILRVPPRRGGRGGASLDELAAADASAERLISLQPLFREYRALFVRARTRYAQALHAAGQSSEPNDGRRAARVLQLFESALAVGDDLLADDVRDPRFVMHVLAGYGSFALCHHGDGNTEQARAIAHRALDLIERLQREWGGRLPLTGRRGPRRPPPRGDGPGPPRRNPMGDLVRHLDDDEISARWQRMTSGK